MPFRGTRAPSIKEQGGLQPYLTGIGVDYDEFIRLNNILIIGGYDKGYKVTKASMGRALAPDGRDKFSAHTIAKWIKLIDNDVKL